MADIDNGPGTIVYNTLQNSTMMPFIDQHFWAPVPGSLINGNKVHHDSSWESVCEMEKIVGITKWRLLFFNMKLSFETGTNATLGAHTARDWLE